MKVVTKFDYKCSFSSTEEEAFYQFIRNASQKPWHEFIQTLSTVTLWPFEFPSYLTDWKDVLDSMDTMLEQLLQKYQDELIVMKIPVLEDDISNRLKSMEEMRKKEERHESTAMEDDMKDPSIVHNVSLEDAKNYIYEILRFTTLLLENSARKHIYNSTEHIIKLLVCNSRRISFLALKVLMAEVLPERIHTLVNSNGSSKTPISYKKALVPLLYHIMVGTEVKNIYDNGLYETVVNCKKNGGFEAVITKEFRFILQENDAKNPTNEEKESKGIPSLVTIPIDLPTETSETMLSPQFRNYVEMHKIPAKYHFMLFRKLQACFLQDNRSEEVLRIVEEKLMALFILLSLEPPPARLNLYLKHHLELWDDIGKLVMVEPSGDISFSIRKAGMYALLALFREMHDDRATSVSLNQNDVFSALRITTSATYSSVSSILRFCMSQMEALAQANTTADSQSTKESTPDMGMMLGITFVHATTTPFMQNDKENAQWLECLLLLIQEILLFDTGASALIRSGLVPSMLAFLEHSILSLEAGFLMALCSRILGCAIINSPSAVSMFKELEGIEILSRRLHDEVVFVVYHGAEKVKLSRKSFILAILGTLSIASHPQRISGGSVAISSLFHEESKINKALMIIFANPTAFGNIIYAQAMSFVSDVLNNDAISSNTVHSTGLALCLLSHLQVCISNGINRQFILAIPNIVGALCLATDRRSAVISHNCFAVLFEAVLHEDYEDLNKKCSHELSFVIGGNIEELLRHVSDLRPQCMEECTKALCRVYELGKSLELQPPSLENSKKYRHFLSCVCTITNILEKILPRAGYSTLLEWKGSDVLLNLYPLLLSKVDITDADTTWNEDAVQSLTAAVRSIGSRQPVALLDDIMLSLDRYFTMLSSAKSSLFWNRPTPLLSIFSYSMEPFLIAHRNTLLTDFKSNDEEHKRLLNFFNNLSCIQWLCSVLTSIVQDTQNHSQSRRCYTQFVSKRNLKLLEVLLLIERSTSWDVAISTAYISTLENDKESNLLWLISKRLAEYNASVAKFFSTTVRCIPITGRLQESTEDEFSPSIELGNLLTSFSKKRFKIDFKCDELEYCDELANRDDIAALYWQSAIAFIDACLTEKRQDQLKVHLFLAFFSDDELVNTLRSTLSDLFNTIASANGTPSIITARAFGKYCGFLNKTATCKKRLDFRVLKRMLDRSDKNTSVNSFIEAVHRTLMDGLMELMSHENLLKTPIREVVIPLMTCAMQILASRCFSDGENSEFAERSTSLDYKPDEETVNALTCMGFSRNHVENAIRTVGTNSVEAAMDWLLSHPMEEEANETTTQEKTATETENNKKETSLMYKEMEKKVFEILLKALYEVRSDLNTAIYASAELTKPAVVNAKALLCLFSSYLVGLFQFEARHQQESDEIVPYDARVQSLQDIIQAIHLTETTAYGELTPPLLLLAAIVKDDLPTRKLLVKDHEGFLCQLIHVLEQAYSSQEALPFVGSCVLLLGTLAQAPQPTEVEARQLVTTPTYSYFSSVMAAEVLALDLKLLKCQSFDDNLLLAALNLFSRLVRDYELVKGISGDAKSILEDLLHIVRERNDERIASSISTIIRHLCEDPATLQRQMENAIHGAMKKLMGRYGTSETRISPRHLMNELQQIASRQPALFVTALLNMVTIKKAEGTSRLYVQLKAHLKPSNKCKKNLFNSSVAQSVFSVLHEEGHSSDTKIRLIHLLNDLVASIPYFGNLLLNCRVNETHSVGGKKTLNPVVVFFLCTIISNSNVLSAAAAYRDRLHEAVNHLLLTLCQASHEQRSLVVTAILTLIEREVQAIANDESQNFLSYSSLVLVACWSRFLLSLLDIRGEKRSASTVNLEVARLLIEGEAAKVASDVLLFLDLSSPAALNVSQHLLSLVDILTRSSLCEKIKKCTKKQNSIDSSVNMHESIDDEGGSREPGGARSSMDEGASWSRAEDYTISDGMDDDNETSGRLRERSSSLAEGNDHSPDEDEDSTDEESDSSEEDDDEDGDENEEDDGEGEDEVVEFIEESSDHDNISADGDNENSDGINDTENFGEGYPEVEHLLGSPLGRQPGPPTPRRLGRLLENIANIRNEGDTNGMFSDIFRASNANRSSLRVHSTDDASLLRTLFFPPSTSIEDSDQNEEQSLQSQINEAAQAFTSARGNVPQDPFNFNGQNYRRNPAGAQRNNAEQTMDDDLSHPLLSGQFGNGTTTDAAGNIAEGREGRSQWLLRFRQMNDDPVARAITSTFPNASLRFFMAPGSSNRSRRGGMFVRASDGNRNRRVEHDGRDLEGERVIGSAIEEHWTTVGLSSIQETEGLGREDVPATEENSAKTDGSAAMVDEGQEAHPTEPSVGEDSEARQEEASPLSATTVSDVVEDDQNDASAAANEDPDRMSDTDQTENRQNETLTGEEQQEDQRTENAPTDELQCPPGIDREVFESLPADIRAEIMETERQEQTANRQEETTADSQSAQGAVAEDMDNASFLASLTPDLREEVLITSEDAFLRTLPAAIQAEAQVLRERAATHFHGLADFIREESRGNNRLGNAVFMVPGAGHGISSNRERQTTRKNTGKIILSKEIDEDFHLLESHVKGFALLLFFGKPRVLLKVFHNLCESFKWRSLCLETLLSFVKEDTEKGKIEENIALWNNVPISSLAEHSSKDFSSKLLGLLSHLILSPNNRISYYLMSNTDEGTSRLCGLVNWACSPSILRNTSNLNKLLFVLRAIITFGSSEIKDEREGAENAEETPMNEEEKDIVDVPSPVLSSDACRNLLCVLLSENCTETALKILLEFIEKMARMRVNQAMFVSFIGEFLKEVAPIVSENLKRLQNDFNSGKLKSLMQDCGCAAAEWRFYRLLKALACSIPAIEDFVTCCQSASLTQVWDVLNVLLHSTMAATKVANENHTTEKSDYSLHLSNVTARFLPLIEAFFIAMSPEAAKIPIQMQHRSLLSEADIATASIAKSQGTTEGSNSSKPPSSPRRNPTTVECSKTVSYLNSFVEENRVLLNLLVRHNSALLESSMACLVKYSGCRAFLDFDNKRTYFQVQMKRLRSQPGGGSGTLRLQVRRSHIFEDSFNSLRMRTSEEMRRKLQVTFYHEEGIDAGGVTREFYVVLAREMFNPNYALFINIENSPIFQPNPLSYVNRQHLDYFKFVGRIIGKAICDGQLLDAHFTRSFYKHILGIPISYHDMEAIDPEYYRHLHNMLDEDISNYGIELTFSTEKDHFGKIEIIDLIPNGRNIHVTNENKMEYIKLITHYRMTTAIKEQIQAFLDGFYELVSKELVSLFNENELELLISGMPEIDIDDLRSNTDYTNYKPSDEVIQWFWKCLYDFSHEERALFLQFVTGTSKVPLDGFKALVGMRGTQKFSIHKAYMKSENMLPSAHTCFNQLDLPEYKSEDQLRDRLLLAIREGSEGFGFG